MYEIRCERWQWVKSLASLFTVSKALIDVETKRQPPLHRNMLCGNMGGLLDCGGVELVGLVIELWNDQILSISAVQHFGNADGKLIRRSRA